MLGAGDCDGAGAPVGVPASLVASPPHAQSNEAENSAAQSDEDRGVWRSDVDMRTLPWTTWQPKCCPSPPAPHSIPFI